VKRIGYYPGCSLHSAARDYDRTVNMVFEALAIELHEVQDWACCGASSAHTTDDLLALALPARTLALAEQQGLSELLIPCSACFLRLLLASERMKGDDGVAERVNEIIHPLQYRGMVEPRNILDVLINEVGIPALSARLVRELGGIPVVAYYGCLLTRTVRIPSFDDREDPQSMDRILRAMGANPLPWPSKMDCCGGSLTISEEELTAPLCRDIVRMAVAVGAEAIVTTCPLCQANVDMFAFKHKEEGATLPVLYITDLLGVALGCQVSKRLWRKKLIDPTAVLSRYGLVT
jgi:heterodisulfide reductase subunit B